MPFATSQSSAAAAKGFNTCIFCRGRRLEASVSFFRSKSDDETESTRPLQVLFGCVRKPGTLALARLRRRANRLDDTPQMHRRLAFMLLASARALRPLARTLRGGNTLRKASSATTMSDTHCYSVLNFRRKVAQRNYAVAATPHHTGTSTTWSSAPAAAASRARAARPRMVQK